MTKYAKTIFLNINDFEIMMLSMCVFVLWNVTFQPFWSGESKTLLGKKVWKRGLKTFWDLKTGCLKTKRDTNGMSYYCWKSDFLMLSNMNKDESQLQWRVYICKKEILSCDDHPFYRKDKGHS